MYGSFVYHVLSTMSETLRIGVFDTKFRTDYARLFLKLR